MNPKIMTMWMLLAVAVAMVSSFTIKDHSRSVKTDTEVADHKSKLDIPFDKTLQTEKPTTGPIISKISAEEVDMYTDLLDNVLDSLSTLQEDTADSTLSTFCQTPECVQQLRDYMAWREAHGYPAAGGRWG